MGTAWRELGAKKTAFKRILGIVRDVKKLDLEVCCTLGMLNKEQASQLKEAGLDAYNHNLDTSREHYKKVTSTRNYDDRLATLEKVRDAGISVCCGGILGLGEKEADRVSLLHTLCTQPEHPESVPVNALVPVKGTPMENNTPPDTLEMVRYIAAARILMPGSVIRLSAGRLHLSVADQAFCFYAGANSIFNGDKLLTTDNPDFDKDQMLFDKLGFVGKPAHQGPMVAPAEAGGEVRITKVQGQQQLYA